MTYQEKQEIIKNFKILLKVYGYFTINDEMRRDGAIEQELKNGIINLIKNYLHAVKTSEYTQKLYVARNDILYTIETARLGFIITIEEKNKEKQVFSLLNGEFIVWLVETFDEFSEIKNIRITV